MAEAKAIIYIVKRNTFNKNNKTEYNIMILERETDLNFSGFFLVLKFPSMLSKKPTIGVKMFNSKSKTNISGNANWMAIHIIAKVKAKLIKKAIKANLENTSSFGFTGLVVANGEWLFDFLGIVSLSIKNCWYLVFL